MRVERKGKGMRSEREGGRGEEREGQVQGRPELTDNVECP